MLQPEVRQQAIVAGKNGLHLRPAQQIAELAQSFVSSIQIVKDDNVIDGKSLLQLMTLQAGMGTSLIVVAKGDDASLAADAIAKVIQSDDTASA